MIINVVLICVCQHDSDIRKIICAFFKDVITNTKNEIELMMKRWTILFSLEAIGIEKLIKDRNALLCVSLLHNS